jgi:hypothetical protein
MKSKSPREPKSPRKPNPRFLWNIGAIAEEYPDMPKQYGTETVLWDRQERKPVLTLHDGYRNLICLEHLRLGHPFTDASRWLNTIARGDLKSEGITDTRKPFTRE